MIKNILNLSLTIVVLFISIYWVAVHLELNNIFNSDQLNLPYLYKDLFIHHGTLSYWKFSPTNYLFPDGVILFSFIPFFENFKLAIVLTNYTILILYYISMVSLGTLICGKENKNVFRIFTLLSLVLASGSLTQQEIMDPLFNSHFSDNVIIFLWELILISKLLINPKKTYYGLLFIITLLANLSDPLATVIMLGSPFIASIAIYKTLNHSQKFVLKRILILLSIAALLNFSIIKLHLFHLKIKTYPLRFIFSTQVINNLYQSFFMYFQKNPFIIIITFCYLIISMILFFRVLLSTSKQGLTNTQTHCGKLIIDILPVTNPLKLQKLFVIFSIGSCIAILIIFSLIFDHDILTPSFHGLRHFNAAILIPVFLGIPILLTQSTYIGALINRYYYLFALLLLTYLLLFNPYKKLDSLLHYYPPLTKCLDDYYESGQLLGKNGVATYFNAHINGILSKNDLNIVSVNPDYSPYDWMSTQHDYLNKPFNFIILDVQDDHVALRYKNLAQFGQPHAILKCMKNETDYVTIYTYKKSFAVISH